jgi:hypothetical protein
MKAAFAIGLFAISLAAGAEDWNDGTAVSLAVKSTAGSTVMSQQIFGAQSVQAKLFHDGLGLSVSSPGIGATWGATTDLQSNDIGCGKRTVGTMNTVGEEIFMVFDDYETKEKNSACPSAPVAKSRMVVTVVEKKTGKSSVTILEEK